jgi:hypothetical protein
MSKCDIIPRIKNKNGEWVDSLLFKSLLDNFKNNREEAKRVYEMVHSPSFIDWFGDWINSPETSSKVVDENGEPMIVYRGGVEGYNNSSKKYLYFTNDKPEASLFSKAHISKSGQTFERVSILDIQDGLFQYLLAEEEIDQTFIDLYPMAEEVGWEEFLESGTITNDQYSKYSNFQNSNSLLSDFQVFKSLYNATRIDSDNDLTKPYDDMDYISSIDDFNELLPFFKQFSNKPTGVIESVFLSIKKPFDNGVHEDMTNDRDAYLNGHDGAALLNGEHFLIKKGTKQVKSIENKGEFSKENDNIYYQLGSKEPLDKQIDELDQHLITFLKKFGVSFKEFDNLKERLGIDALGATDVLNKLIWFNKERNSETIPEEVGHMITMLMGSNNPDMTELLSEITNWSEYADIKKQYMPIYNNEAQVKIEAVGKLLAKALVKNYKANGLDKGLLQKVLDSVMELINKVLEFLDLGTAMYYHEKIADKIALNVLMGNTDYVAQLKSMSPKLDYNEALKNNPHAQYIIDTFTKDKAQFKLTGSLALAGQGETIYRKAEEPIHDIDFVVGSEQEYTNIVSLLKEIGAEPVHFGWDSASKDYRTNAFFIPKPGYRVDVVERDHQRGNGWATDYKLYDNNGVEVPITAENLIAVDFFINKTGDNNKFNGVFKSYVDIYDGKMSLGKKGKEERLFSREKDQQDYVLMKPKNLTPAPSSYIYYQLSKEERNFYEAQNMNSDQKGILDTLLSLDKATLPSKDAKFYEVPDEKTGEVIDLSRVSDVIKSTWTGSSNSKYADFGTAVDKMLAAIVLGKSDAELPKSPLITDAAHAKLIPILRSVHEKLTKDGSVIVGQYITYNLDSLIAGSIDILIIKPDGSLAVYDLKTSKDAVYDGENFSKKYLQIQSGNGIVRSKKDQHIAQLSAYKRLLELQGFQVKEVGIIPVHLTLDKTHDSVLDAELETIEGRQFSEQVASLIGEKPNWVEDANTEIISKLRIYFQKRIEQIERQTSKAKNSRARVKELRQLQNLLKGIDVAGEVSLVINSLYSDMEGDVLEEGEVRNKQTVSEMLVALERKIKRELKGDISEDRAHQLMQELNIFKVYADNLEILEELDDILAESVTDQLEPAFETPLYKLNRLKEIRGTILSTYDKLSKPIIDAAYINYASDELNTEAQAEYEGRKKGFEEEIKKLEAEIGNQPPGKKPSFWQKAFRTKEARLASLKKALDNLKRDRDRIVVKKGTIEQDLTRVDRDINFFDRVLDPAISSSSRPISLFAKKLKSKLYRNDMRLLDLKHQAKDSFFAYAAGKEHLRNNPFKFNEGLITRVSEWVKSETGEWVERVDNEFVQEIDYHKFNIELNKHLSNVNKQGLTRAERTALNNKWYAENTETKPFEDKTITINGETVVIEKGIHSIIEQKKKELKDEAITPEQFYGWVLSNMFDSTITMPPFSSRTPESTIIYGKLLLDSYEANPDNITSFRRDLSRPKTTGSNNYSSKLYKEMRSDKTKSDYYDFLIHTYFKAQQRYPILDSEKELGFKIPMKHKSKRDMIMEGEIKNSLVSAWEETFTITERDKEVYGSDQKGIIPIYYTTRISADEVSLDLISSVLAYEQASSEFEVKSNLHAEAIGIQHGLDTRLTDKTDNGRGVLDALGKKIGITTFRTLEERSNAAKLFEAFVRMQLYGQTTEVEKIGNVRVDKVVNSLMSATSLLTLGGSELLKSVANWGQANVQQVVEGVAKQFVSPSNLKRGKGRVTTAIKNILNDFANPVATSLEGQLADMYQFRQGSFKDEYGNDVSATALKKMAVSGTYMFGMNAGEWENQMSFGFAMMDTITLKDSNGKEISLLDAYELVDGRAKLKDGLTKKDGTPFEIADQEKLMMRIHHLNKRMHGVYNRQDRVEAKMHSIGRLATMFKNFLVPTVKKRFKEYGGDQELGGVTEGFYRTFYFAVLNQKKDLIALLMRKDNNLTPLQKANIRRAITELSFIAALTLITFIMKGMAGDDPEYKKSNTVKGYAYNFMLYEVMRLNSEMQFYLPIIGIDDQLRIFKNPSAINSTLTRMTRLGMQLFNPLEEYETGNGFNAKGDNKLVARLLNLGGVNGANLNPQIAQEFLNYK